MNPNEKTFDQLNDKELLDLTEEQIEFYIKLKKAETGIRIIKCPEIPEYREIPKPDLTVYGAFGFYFDNLETAEEIVKLVNSKSPLALNVNYNYNYGSDKKYAKPFEGSLTEVDVKQVYSEEVYNSITNILSSNKKIEDAYNKLKEEYDEQNEKSQEIVDNIYSKIAEAKERKELYEDYVIRIKDYLRLSNGDITIAWNFFNKAYEIEPSIKNRIIESDEYINEVNSYKN